MGSDRATLTLLYTALIRSKIDYGSFLYAKAAKVHLTRIDRIQYEAIRIIAGLYRSTPIIHLEAELNILPLEHRREKLMLRYFTKILRLEDHPVTIEYNKFYNHTFYHYRPYALPVIGRAKVLIAPLPNNV